MEETLRVLNSLERDGVLRRYAIGGAMAATFYTEPVLTFDLDIFVLLPTSPGALLTLSPLYEALRSRGFSEEGEFVKIEGVPVQFLPVYNDLLREALGEAREVPYGSTTTRVLRAEHLAAIAVQTGRQKDRDRLRMLVDQAGMNREYLTDILVRHGLEEKWREWTR